MLRAGPSRQQPGKDPRPSILSLTSSPLWRTSLWSCRCRSDRSEVHSGTPFATGISDEVHFRFLGSHLSGCAYDKMVPRLSPSSFRNEELLKLGLAIKAVTQSGRTFPSVSRNHAM